MVQVTVTINGRDYQVACDDGQEAHLTRLGSYVDNRMGELSAAVGQIGDAREASVIVRVCSPIGE